MSRAPKGKALTAAERMRRYRARRRAAGLRSIASWAPGSIRDQVLAKAPVIRTLAKAHGARSVELFGSAARREDRPDSDIDLMVEFEEGRSLLDLIALGDDLQMALGRKVEVVSKSAMKRRVRETAERDALRVV